MGAAHPARGGASGRGDGEARGRGLCIWQGEACPAEEMGRAWGRGSRRHQLGRGVEAAATRWGEHKGNRGGTAGEGKPGRGGEATATEERSRGGVAGVEGGGRRHEKRRDHIVFLCNEWQWWVIFPQLHEEVQNMDSWSTP